MITRTPLKPIRRPDFLAGSPERAIFVQAAVGLRTVGSHTQRKLDRLYDLQACLLPATICTFDVDFSNTQRESLPKCG